MALFSGYFQWKLETFPKIIFSRGKEYMPAEYQKRVDWAAGWCQSCYKNFGRRSFTAKRGLFKGQNRKRATWLQNEKPWGKTTNTFSIS